MKIWMRLTGGFASVLLLSMTLAAITTQEMDKIQDRLERIVEGHISQTWLLNDISKSVLITEFDVTHPPIKPWFSGVARS